MEKVAQQALQESEAEDSSEDEFRLALVQLVNSVKQRDADATQRLAKQCLDIALRKIEKEPAWIGQFVSIYALLMNDQLGYQQTDEALYFADKAIESAHLSIGTLEDSQAYRLLGNTLLSKASILVGMQQWRPARELYLQGSGALCLLQGLLYADGCLAYVWFMFGEDFRRQRGCRALRSGLPTKSVAKL